MAKRGVSIDMLKGLIREVGHIAINSSYISLKTANERLEYLNSLFLAKRWPKIRSHRFVLRP